MKFTMPLTLFTVLLLLASFAYGQDVHYNYDRATSFESYKTYQWVDFAGVGGKIPDSLIDQSIKRAVDEQLAQKGLTRVEKGGDLTIGYHAILREETRMNLNVSGWGGGPFSAGWGDGGLSSGIVDGQTSTIPVGMLLIDIYDSTKQQLIWRGDATKTIDLRKDPERNYRNLQKAVAKLFKNYPPPTHK